MRKIILLIIYLTGGVALYPWVDVLGHLAMKLDNLYSWAFLNSGTDMAIYQLASFSYASLFHLILAAIFSEPAKSWVSTITCADIGYLFLRLFGFFLLCLLILALVGVSVVKRPYSGFHMYFSVLVACVLLGGWAWSVKDFFLAVINYSARRFV